MVEISLNSRDENGDMERFRLVMVPGILALLILGAVSIPVSATDNSKNNSVFDYKVQEDPYFTFAYPAGMVQTITSIDGRNTYRLVNDKKHPVTYYFTSAVNPDGVPLTETALAGFEASAIKEVLGPESSTNLSLGKPVFDSDTNQSSYFMSYLDNDKKDLIFVMVRSSGQQVVSAVLTEPAILYNTDYGNFTLKSLLSLTPRTLEVPFTLTPVGNDRKLGEKSNTTPRSSDKAIAYDPYSGLFYDTDTGYYYLPYYGVFYNPTTGDYYYPKEFGSYDSTYFPDYSGIYDTSGLNSGGYYDGLYGGYSGTSGGYDASDIINSAYTNRQETYDAANAMWSDYIRGDTYYGADSSGNLDPIDTIQEYKDYGLS